MVWAFLQVLAGGHPALGSLSLLESIALCGECAEIGHEVFLLQKVYEITAFNHMERSYLFRSVHPDRVHVHFISLHNF